MNYNTITFRIELNGKIFQSELGISQKAFEVAKNPVVFLEEESFRLVNMVIKEIKGE